MNCFFNQLLNFIGQNSRSTRTNTCRKKFKVDSLLERVEQKLKESGNADGVPQDGFMTVTFLGYYDGKKSYKFLEGSAPVELVLLKLCHKKRKETPYMMETVGMVEVPCNPSEDHPPNKAPTISVPAESLTTSNGQPVSQKSIPFTFFYFNLAEFSSLLCAKRLVASG